MPTDLKSDSFLKNCESLLKSGKLVEVVKLCDEKLEKETSAAALRMKGIALQETGDPDGAEKCFKNAISEGWADSDNYYYYGFLLLNEKRFEEALILFGISNLLAEGVDGLFMLAMTYLLLNRAEEAALSMRKAVAIDKDKTVALMNNFFDRYYKDNKAVSNKDKATLKAEIERIEHSS